MKPSRNLLIAPFLLLSACTVIVEDNGYSELAQGYQVPYWAKADYQPSNKSTENNLNVAEDKIYKIDLGINKTESNDIKVSLYLLECEDPKSKDHCTKAPLNQSIGFSYAINDGYTGELLESNSVTTSDPQYIIHTKNNYPECLTVTVNNSKNLSINSQNINFNESKVVGC